MIMLVSCQCGHRQGRLGRPPRDRELPWPMMRPRWGLGRRCHDCKCGLRGRSKQICAMACRPLSPSVVVVKLHSLRPTLTGRSGGPVLIVLNVSTSRTGMYLWVCLCCARAERHEAPVIMVRLMPHNEGTRSKPTDKVVHRRHLPRMVAAALRVQC